MQINQVLNQKLIGGKADLAFSARVFQDPPAQNSEAARSLSWVKGAPSAGNTSLPESVVSLPVTGLPGSLLVSDLVNSESLNAGAFLSCPDASFFKVRSLTCPLFGLL